MACSLVTLMSREAAGHGCVMVSRTLHSMVKAAKSFEKRACELQRSPQTT